MPQKKMTPKEFHEGLDYFYGTENYYKNPLLKFSYTDGVKYIAENAGAYWLLQEINGLTAKINEPFFHIIVTSKDNKADIVVDDGNDNVLKTKHIGFTDLFEGTYHFYLTDNVLMLASEY